MAFQDGHKKIGGRKAATPNKRTTTLIEILEQHGYSPVAELVEWASRAKDEYEGADALTRHQWAKLGVQNALGILPYLYPKRKALDGDADITPEQAETMSTEDLIAKGEQIIQSFRGLKQ